MSMDKGQSEDLRGDLYLYVNECVESVMSDVLEGRIWDRTNVFSPRFEVISFLYRMNAKDSNA
jgi:hypothetical protein